MKKLRIHKQRSGAIGISSEGVLIRSFIDDAPNFEEVAVNDNEEREFKDRPDRLPQKMKVKVQHVKERIEKDKKDKRDKEDRKN